MTRAGSRPTGRGSRALPAVVVGLAALLATPPAARACTTILVGRSLTADGSVIHAHNEDMGNAAAGRLWWVDAARHAVGESLRVPYVELPQATATLGYWAAGNVPGGSGLGTAAEHFPYDSVLVGLNQNGVSMSCNWAHSRDDNLEGRGIRRYAIRQLLLERASSARHGVEVLGRLIETYGQADWGGLIYHLADPLEAWVVETTTRNWVARRVRDNEIHVSANRFRIGADYDASSARLVSDAVARGWLDSADAPLDFRAVYGLPAKMHQAYDILREERAVALLGGRAGGITPEDLFLVLRDRYEGTEDYTPPQPGPVWREDLDANPALRRTIATNLAQSTFVAHLRGDLPVGVGAVMWFGFATPSYAGYVPLYAAGGAVPAPFAASLADREPSAWQLFRRLQQAADGDYRHAYPAILAFWTGWHAGVVQTQRQIEARALERLQAGDAEEAVRVLRAFTRGRAEDALAHARRMLQLAQDATLPTREPVAVSRRADR